MKLSIDQMRKLYLILLIIGLITSFLKAVTGGVGVFAVASNLSIAGMLYLGFKSLFIDE